MPEEIRDKMHNEAYEMMTGVNEYEMEELNL